MAASDGTGDQQIGYVRTGDQKDDADDHQERCAREYDLSRRATAELASTASRIGRTMAVWPSSVSEYARARAEAMAAMLDS